MSDNPNASKNLFVGSLSWNVDDEWLGREFASFGEIVRAKVMTDRNTGRSKGFGYVEFTNLEDAVKAHKEMTGAQLDGRQINVDFSQPRPENGNTGDRRDQRARNFNDQLSEPTSVLFVGNIAFSANEQIIGDAFGQYGSVSSVRLPTDPDSGNLKGFGYVEFGSVDEAKAALEAMNGAPIEGRPLRLDFSAPVRTVEDRHVVADVVDPVAADAAVSVVVGVDAVLLVVAVVASAQTAAGSAISRARR